MIEDRLGDVEPEVELIALEQPAAESLRLVIDHPDGVDLALCERVTGHLRDLLERLVARGRPRRGAERPLTKPEHFRRFLGCRVRVRTAEEIDGHRTFTGTLTAADEREVSIDAGGGDVRIPLAGIRRSNLIPSLQHWRQRVSREIVEAIKGLEQEKGIDSETLMAALEDALLSAYKKTPGAANYARVDLDRDTADFRVYELTLPEELEEKLLDQAFEELPRTRSIRRPASCASPRTRSSTPRCWRPTRTRSSRATSPPTTSAGSPPRPPSR